MKKSILFITMLISINCVCQTKTSDILDKFKFGSSYENSTELEERSKKDGIISYTYIGSEIFKIGTIEINNINLVYFENKLMAIEINFGNPLTKDSFETTEFEKVRESLIAELGKFNYEKNNSNPQVINEIDWKKENVNFNLKRLNYKYENVDYILGLFLLRDIKLSEKFMANLKR
jgi:hypothetical protein